MYIMKQYDDALRMILDKGVKRTNKRTGIKTKAIFGMLCRYSLDKGRFPLLTRRKVWPKSIFAELIWFLSGSTNNNDLKALGANIWTPWVSPDFEKEHGFVDGALGPVYGFQLRHFGGEYGNGGPDWMDLKGDSGVAKYYGLGGFDQLLYVVNRIKEDPSCRRILFDLWNPRDLKDMRLPPCHYSYQVLIDDDGLMTGSMVQRSADFPIGVPANIQFYSALTMMLAQQTGYTAHELVHYTVDSHIYEDQIEAIETYLALPTIDSPRLKIHKADDITSYKPEDFELEEFVTGPKIEIPVAV